LPSSRINPYLSPRFSSSSGLGGLSLAGISSSGGNAKQSLFKKKFGNKLSSVLTFDNFITGIALLAFSLFLVVFYFNALQGIGRRRRTSADGVEVDNFEIFPSDYVMSGAFLRDLFRPSSALYTDYIPAFSNEFLALAKAFWRHLASGMKETVLDVVGTSRGPDGYISQGIT
jgi:hypothetical protein